MNQEWWSVQASCTNGAGSSAQLRLVTTVTQAGSYALSVAVTDPATKAVRRIPARGSPDTVMVGHYIPYMGYCRLQSMQLGWHLQRLRHGICKG